MVSCVGVLMVFGVQCKVCGRWFKAVHYDEVVSGKCLRCLYGAVAV